MGCNVLLVDCDEGTYGLTLLFLAEVRDKRKESPKVLGLFEPSLEPIDIQDWSGALVELKASGMLLPSTYRFQKMDPINTLEFEERLHRITTDGRATFDYIILDAQAGAAPISQIAMSSKVSDQVIIVSEYDPLSAAGIERLKVVMGDQLSFERTWVLLNKMLPEFVSSFSEFLSVARYLPPIPWTADVVRAYSRRRLALDFDQPNQYTLAAMQTLKALLNEDDAKRLDRWAEGKAVELREPIDLQLADLANELNGLYEMARKDERFENLRKLIPGAMFAVLPLLLAFLVHDVLKNVDLQVVSGLFRKEDWTIIGAIAAVLGAVVALFLMGDRSTSRVMRASVERQILATEENLKRLEALRSASLSEIINARRQRGR